MTTPDRDRVPQPHPHPLDEPTTLAAAMESGSERIAGALHGSVQQTKLRGRYLLAVYIAQFSLFLALVAPAQLSLAVRVESIDPVGKDAALALTIGIPGVVAILIAPIVGILSDRTRSRFGRRRPWFLVGMIIGFVGSAMIGFASGIPMVITGWTIAFAGYTICNAMILTHLGDRLPESQRGRVLGVNGALTQIGPIVGIILASMLVTTPIALFVVPGLIALVGGLIFVIAMRDQKIAVSPTPISTRSLLEGYWFNPRRYPNLAWVWLSKAFIYAALSLGIYGVYLLSSRMGLDPAEVAGVVSTTSILSVGGAIIGAIGSGVLSDRLKTRKPFLIVSSLILAVAMIIIATTSSVPQYVVGSLLLAFAIGVYGAVDQALSLDVLPTDEGQNGRYLAILNLANQIPQAIGPLIAGAVVGLASGNYAVVYIVAGIAALAGAFAIIPISVGKRATHSTTSIHIPE